METKEIKKKFVKNVAQIFRNEYNEVITESFEKNLNSIIGSVLEDWEKVLKTDLHLNDVEENETKEGLFEKTGIYIVALPNKNLLWTVNIYNTRSIYINFKLDNLTDVEFETKDLAEKAGLDYCINNFI